jgi:NADH-quinone oxidoreductase subunit G
MLLDPKRLSKALEASASGSVKAAIVLENDMFRSAGTEAVERFLSRVAETVVIDHSPQATAHRAQTVLPGSTFAETEGTIVNGEGRAQRFFAVMSPRGAGRDSWRWLAAAHPRHDWQCLDEVTRACAEAVPVLAPIIDAAPFAGFRIDGMKIPRQTHRRSGRTAATAHIDIHEPQPQADTDSALAFTMEGDAFDAPAALRPYSWAPGWNSNGQSIAKFQEEVGGALRGGDPGIRLFESAHRAAAAWFTEMPRAGAAEPGVWLTVPLHHVFGSEALSARAEPVAERSPAPYVALNPEDLARLGNADSVEIDWHGFRKVLPVLADDTLVTGTIGVPVGLPGMPSGPCPRTLTLQRAEPHGSGGPA